MSRERDAAGQTRYYDYDSQGARQGQGSAPTTTPDPASYRSYGHDANGTVEEVQATDGAVSTEDRYRYDPYGELEKRDPSAVSFDPDAPESELSEAARENPFRFQGFYYDSGVKTYDMHARNYRPDTGRFLSQDRFESASGDFNLQADPLTQNRYVFGGANPVNNIGVRRALLGLEGAQARVPPSRRGGPVDRQGDREPCGSHPLQPRSATAARACVVAERWATYTTSGDAPPAEPASDRSTSFSCTSSRT